MDKKILVTGALGQIGSELVPTLRQKFGADNVIASDVRMIEGGEGVFIQADATDKSALARIIKENNIGTIYHLVGILSANGEKDPALAWRINMESLRNILDLCVEHKIKRLFWPSSIAAFGPTTPLENTPQKTVLEPTTMYGVTKVAGELLCQYYHLKYGLDVRSLRYPGIISWKTAPGGGTTDYAVAIYYDAVAKGSYDCFVREDTVLPMMYMDDAVRATLELMAAPSEKIKIRTSYNLSALSFSARALADNVAKHVPGFSCSFTPDSRQRIADSWPKSVDDSAARQDWGWLPAFDLDKISEDMIKNLQK